MSTDYAIKDHQAWLGYLQPDGLVVSAAALSDSQVLVDRNAAQLQRQFHEFVEEAESEGGETLQLIRDLRELLTGFLDWPAEALIGLDGAELPEALTSPMPEFGETLAPTLALRSLSAAAEPAWLLLISEVAPEVDLDARTQAIGSHWSASPSQRLERLLRDTRVPIGLLTNHRQIRLMYAPRGENAGTLTFPVAAMCEVPGRLILSAFHTLLGRFSLFNAPSDARLPALLVRSRNYQARVSTTLSGQVLDALYELLRGFQAADEKAKGKLLHEVLASDPDLIYRGLLTTLLRLVFLLFAEDRGLMPDSSLYQRNYALHGLFERLRTDAEHYPDTMDQRFGAWAQLLALFRAVHAGCRVKGMEMPARRGYLFDPTRFPFLEGSRESGVPLVADGVIHRVLTKLLLLDGERLSYRTLDVEQIGSVYETMMGFKMLRVGGLSVALKPAKARGAPPVVDLDALLALKKDRAKWLKEHADQILPAPIARAVELASSVSGLLEALQKRIATRATPHPVAPGGLALQPNDQRRKQGSHYTPRAMTEPIVRTTLAPVFEQLGPRATPAQILELKVCDPAVGSGAFLVETCRQLAEALVKAWHQHNELPPIPPDEDELLLARRLVAQRCLYGVDRNPMAVDLAKLSLWLATLAKDHPFTFLDHSIREGDSLVGLTRAQIEDMDWVLRPGGKTFGLEWLERRLNAATASRREILNAGDYMLPEEKALRLSTADESLNVVRETGDLVLAAFFAEAKPKPRRQKLDQLRNLQMGQLSSDFLKGRWDAAVDVRLDAERATLGLRAFHWEIEFPEVFDRRNPGFDAMVGNPPFAGKNTLINGNREHYLDWLQTLHEGAHGNADLVAHFFRRAFNLLRERGSFGLIATNTIAQGDTRGTGLRWICAHGGEIYAATRRFKWPGEAAVVVSVVHFFNGKWHAARILDGREVPIITAFLFHAGGNEDPVCLVANEGKSFQGSILLGMGFTFDDTDKKGVASSLAHMHELIAKNNRNGNRIFPYLGGEEVNDSPTHLHHRYVINFGNMPLRRDSELGDTWSGADVELRKLWIRSGVVPTDFPDAVAEDWPDLLGVVREKVAPERLAQKDEGGRRYWWRFLRVRPELTSATRALGSVIAIPRVSSHLSFAVIPTGSVWSDQLIIIADCGRDTFATLQSRVHEAWVRFFSSSLEDRLRYTPTDCFETFPFPSMPRGGPLASVGEEYLSFRSEWMRRKNEGLTETYNRFHDPEDHAADIVNLRHLHEEMDREVLNAYGWTDLQPVCEFILDHDGDEDEGSRRKKPWRYRWCDDIRDDVLARLLKLNQERAREEQLAGLRDAGRRARRGDDDEDLGL